jgi:type IV pilus assembly protein PilE
MVRAHGFTITEMAVALAVAGILAAVAIPNYLEYGKRGRRADAVAALTQVQLAQERWRANNASYADDLSALGVATNSPSGHYALSITQADAVGYSATATASSAEQTHDTHCITLRVTMAGGNLSYGSADSSNAADTTGANRCWVR